MLKSNVLMLEKKLLNIRRVIKLIIEIESYYGDKILHGKHLKRRDIENALDEILQHVNESDFPSVFCARYDYEELDYSDSIDVDYVIDLDTHLIFKPQY